MGLLAVSVVYLLLFSAHLTTSISDHPKVLLISFDGFRHDILNASTAPTIHHWASQSTWFVNGVQSQYLTYTAPNHLSIVTGLYEESHGVTGNRFLLEDGITVIDYYGTAESLKQTRQRLDEGILGGDPIWLTNERAHPARKSFVLNWPFVEAFFQERPHRPKSFEPWSEYGTLETFKGQVDRLVKEFTDGNSPANFAAWYVDQPDSVLHKHGFYTGHFERTLTELDELFGYLLTRMRAAGLEDKVNIILTTDHGHAEVAGYKHVFCIRDYLSGSYRFGDLAIYPETTEQAEAMYKNLTEAVAALGLDIKIHRKRDLPERFHFKNTRRAGEILLEPGIGYSASFRCSGKSQEEMFGPGGRAEFHSSVHGQSPEHREMRAVLVMAGPNIEQRRKISEIPENVDLYPLLCRLLGLDPSPNNGSSSIVNPALKEPLLYNMK